MRAVRAWLPLFVAPFRGAAAPLVPSPDVERRVGTRASLGTPVWRSGYRNRGEVGLVFAILRLLCLPAKEKAPKIEDRSLREQGSSRDYPLWSSCLTWPLVGCVHW